MILVLHFSTSAEHSTSVFTLQNYHYVIAALVTTRPLDAKAAETQKKRVFFCSILPSLDLLYFLLGLLLTTLSVLCSNIQISLNREHYPDLDPLQNQQREIFHNGRHKRSTVHNLVTCNRHGRPSLVKAVFVCLFVCLQQSCLCECQIRHVTGDALLRDSTTTLNRGNVTARVSTCLQRRQSCRAPAMSSLN